MAEEHLQTGAEGILAVLSMSGTTSVTIRIIPAAQAFSREIVSLEESEAKPLLTIEELCERGLTYVAELVLWSHEMVARIDISVVLDGQPFATGLPHGAYTRRQPAPLSEGHIEYLHIAAADIPSDPFVEDAAKEASEALRRHRPRGLAAVREPVHGWKKLHEAAAGFVTEEAIDFSSSLLAKVIDHAQGIEIHVHPVHQAGCPEDPVESGPSSLVDSIAVVDILRAVERKADKKSVVRKEAAPVLVYESAIGLKGIMDILASGILALQLEGALEIIEPEHQRLSSVPAKLDSVRLLGLYELPDVHLQQLRAHHGLTATIQFSLFQVIAVAAR